MDDLLKKILLIIESETVEGYMVGVSVEPYKSGRSYKRFGFEGFAVMKTELTPLQAKRFKQSYYDYIHNHKNSIYYKKYNPKNRDDAFNPSIGGVDVNEKRNDFNFYIVWWYKK